MAYKRIVSNDLASLTAYELCEHRFLKDVNTDAYILEHKKSGAHIMILPSDSKNKVFYIAFRTSCSWRNEKRTN